MKLYSRLVFILNFGFAAGLVCSVTILLYTYMYHFTFAETDLISILTLLFYI